MNSKKGISKSPIGAENQNLISPHIQNLHRMMTETAGKSTTINMSMKKRIANLLSWKVFEYFIVTLIIFYTLIVFVNFGLDDSNPEDDTPVNETIYILSILELIILIIFTFEILANIYVYTFRYYFRDRLLLFDALVIMGSIVLVITDFTITDNPAFTLISKIIRGIFRFFRIFLLFRKVNQFNKIKVAYSRYDVKSPVEKIIEILKNLQENLKKEEEDVKKIAWCIEVISSNRLYDPILENMFKENSNQKEMLDWLANFSVDHQKKKSNSNNSNVISEIKKDPESAENEEWRRKRNSILEPTEIHKTQSAFIEGIIPIIGRNYLTEMSGELEFNVFEFCTMVEGDGLVCLLMHLFEENSLFEKLNIDPQIFYNFSKKIQSGYLNNPYHNYIHATDVTQTVNFFIKTCKFAEMSNLTNLETAAMYFAASIHDFEHNGLNNAYHIATRSILAIRYNDRSVLENHHISASFILTQKENLNIFSKFSKEDYSKLRERVISMVLSTDMTNHFNDLSKVKGRLATSDFDIKDKDKNMCMDSLLHAADISNPIKPFDIVQMWTDKVLAEFWQQGDEERKLNLPISYLMDRYTVNTAKSQIGFIEVIIMPTYEVIKSFLPEMQSYIGNLETNKNHWKEKIEEYDQKLKLLLEKKSDDENNSKTAVLIAEP